MLSMLLIQNGKTSRTLPLDMFTEIIDDLAQRHKIKYLPNGRFIAVSDQILDVEPKIYGLIKDENLCYALFKPYEIFPYDDMFYTLDYNYNILSSSKKEDLSIDKAALSFRTHYPQLNSKMLTWLTGEDTGLSALSMASMLFSGNIKSNGEHPQDIGDLGRCMRFMKEFPELKKDLNKLSDISREWKNLVDNWDKLENNYFIDEKNKNYTNTKSLLKECISVKKTNKP